jgi:hypothetical protein
VVNDPTTDGGARVNRSPGRYRLAMSPVLRAARVAVLGLAAVLFLAFALGSGVDVLWRAFGVAGLAWTVVAVRIVVGSAVAVGDQGLRITRSWPLRRDIPWYRILEVEVQPGTWVLQLELNSGERVELPPVEHLDLLYREVEDRRHRLDA